MEQILLPWREGHESVAAATPGVLKPLRPPGLTGVLGQLSSPGTAGHLTECGQPPGQVGVTA